jgi:hypothetical protein
MLIKNIFFVKKGIAAKAFMKNIQEGNVRKLRNQINKRTVKILKHAN